MMIWPDTIYPALLALSTLISFILALYSWQDRSSPGFRFFSFWTASIGLYSLAVLLETTSATSGAALTWYLIRWTITLISPALFLYFAAYFADFKIILRQPGSYGTAVVLLIILVLSLTNNQYHFIWTSFNYLRQNNLAFIQPIKGSYYWIYNLFFCIVYSFSAILVSLQISDPKNIFRKQAVVLLIGISITGLWNILLLTNQNSLSNPDLTPCVFAFSELLFAWACFRLRLSDIASAAHKIIIDHMTDPILVLDLNDRVIEINPAGQKLLNLPSKKSSGQPIQKIFPDWEKVIAKGGQTKDILFDLEMERSGQRVYYELRLTTLRDLGEYKAGRLLILHDITDRVRLYDEMQNLAIIDSLTGIFNRRHFYNQALLELERCRRYPTSLAVIMLDIDNFKRFNDTFGHLKGDEVLSTIAGRIQDNIRRIDIFGRFGGEEFILLLPDTQRDKAFQTAERLRDVLSRINVETPAGSVSVTASFGITILPAGQVLTFETLVDRADKALYSAKETGRNRVCVWEGK